MVDVPSAVAGLATSMRLFREIRELAQRGETAEAFEKLAEVQRRYAEATGRLAELEAEVRELRAERELRESMDWADNAYWRGEDGAGPFCPACLDGQGQPARMADRDGSWHCPVCGHHELSPARRERLRQVQRARAQRRRTIRSSGLERP